MAIQLQTRFFDGMRCRHPYNDGMGQHSVTIYDRGTGASVDGLLHKVLNSLQLIDVEIDWAPERLRLLKRRLEQGATLDRLPQHAHWNWASKALEFVELPSYRCLGIEAGAKMQGLVLVSLSGANLAHLPPDARIPSPTSNTWKPPHGTRANLPHGLHSRGSVALCLERLCN